MSDTTPPHGRGYDTGADRLRETADEARRAASETWKDTAEQARQTAGAAADEARRRAEREAERGKAMGAGQLHQWASALDRAADELGSGTLQGQLLRQASDGLDDVARSVEGRSVGEMVEAVADFGRRNPLAFVGSAMVAGFALARFATASRTDEPWEDARSASTAPRSAGSTTSTARRPATTPGDDGDTLRLTDPAPGGSGAETASAPGTASAPTGPGRPYPSAGPVPGTGSDDRHR